MENHPIPQNVTGFQFKLIGNMTIKQFAYVATGVVFAWLFFSSPFSSFIKFPLVFLCAAIGFSLAFLPVEGRSIDAMFVYFIKALFNPNQYIFRKEESQFFKPTLVSQPLFKASVPKTVTQENLRAVLSKFSTPQRNSLDEKEMAFFYSVTKPAQHALPHVPSIQSLPQSQIPTPPPEDLQKQSVSLENQPVKQNPNQEHEKLMQELKLAQLQKEQLEKELAVLRQNLKATATTPPIPVPVAQPAKPPKVLAPMIKKIATKPKVAPGLPIPDAPNVIIGIVKDPRGNVIPNILVEVKDKEENPVRAFKTNAFGQFASATPLLNGVYTLEFDDPQEKHKFDTIELTVTGVIIGPIEVTSIDQREELRKALFFRN